MSVMTVLLRRELWENRAIIGAPVVIGALFVLIALLALGGAISITVGEASFDVIDAIRRVDVDDAGPLMQIALMSLGVAFNTVMILVIAFYLLDSLYADRKDRSILFWKSLPVSDTRVVISKLATAALLIPAVTLAVYLVTIFAIYLIVGAAVAMTGNNAVLVAGPGATLEIAITMLYGLLVQSLWYMPIFGWLLLASAWAKRAALLWALLPPLALVIVEDMIFETERVASLIGDRIVGVFPLAFGHPHEHAVIKYRTRSGDLDVDTVEHLSQLMDPAPLLASPGLWVGFAVAALFVAGAIWLRRYRDET